MNIKWNTEEYSSGFDFVHKYGEDVLKLITAEKGSLAVDLGCGNGALTQKLREAGYKVLGIDDSAEMIEAAKTFHPDLKFIKSDAAEFSLENKADVIFSNAVIHWIDENRQEKLIQNISDNLKTGGEFVCEFGGKGCAQKVHEALSQSFEKRGLSYTVPFYFPSIGEYAPLLEKHGLLVEYAVLFDRPTEQKSENGMENWIRMFLKKPFEGMDAALCSQIIKEASDSLRSSLYINGKWYVDYVRIRFRCRKIL